MKVSTKGQVTIPHDIRKEFGITPGTEIEFVADQGKVILRKKAKHGNPVEQWLKDATGVAKGCWTTGKIMRLTRGED